MGIDMATCQLSCVVPVKGARPYFKDALTSIQNQGLDVEVIVQDGDVEPDNGQSDALNRGFAKAHGDLLFWLNADDVLLPGALKRVLDISERKKHVEWIAGDTVYIDNNDRITSVRCDAKWRPWFGQKLSVWTGGPSSFFKRSLWERLGGFDCTLKYVMDIDLWTRWAQAGVKFARVNDYVWGFRIHDGSKTMGGMNNEEHREERETILSRHGIASERFWRNMSRAASVIDGSWIKRVHDARCLRGMHWKDLTA